MFRNRSSDRGCGCIVAAFAFIWGALLGGIYILSSDSRLIGVCILAIWAISLLVVLYSLYRKDKEHKEEAFLEEQLREHQEHAPLVKWWRPRGKYDEVRQYVLTRDHHRCRECGSTVGIEVHHITRRSMGGTDEPSNLVTLCRRHHDSKHPGAREYYIRMSRRHGKL